MHAPIARGLMTLVCLAGLVVALSACGDADGDAAAPAGEGLPVEQAFLSGMVPHHLSAVAMSEVALEEAESDTIRQLAEGIIAEQEAEIEEMGSIHQRLFDSELQPDPGAHDALGLTAEEAGMGHGDPAEAAALLRGAQPFDLAFVDEMMGHHMGAVRMSESVLADAQDDQVRDLAERIIASQEAEIAEMTDFREAEYPDAPAPAPHGGEMSGGDAHPEGHSG